MGQEETDTPELEAPEADVPGIEEEDTRSNGVPGTDLAERLRQVRKEIGQARHYDLDIPGYNEELVARYNTLEWEDVRKIGERAEKIKNPRKELMAQCDTLIKACEGFFLRVEKEDYPEVDRDEHNRNFIPLAAAASAVVDGVDEDTVIKWDNNLAAFLGFEAKTTRGIVLRVFNNDLAVPAHHNEIAEWMQSSRREDDEDFSTG